MYAITSRSQGVLCVAGSFIEFNSREYCGYQHVYKMYIKASLAQVALYINYIWHCVMKRILGRKVYEMASWDSAGRCTELHHKTYLALVVYRSTSSDVFSAGKCIEVCHGTHLVGMRMELRQRHFL